MEVRRAATCWILDEKSPNLDERVATSTGTSEGRAAGAATSTAGAGAETGAATSTAGALVFFAFFSPERVGAGVAGVDSTTTVTAGAAVEAAVEAEADLDWRTIFIIHSNVLLF
jgi:hypothetical protein